MATSDNEWQRITTSDKESQRVKQRLIQRVKTSDTTSDIECQEMTTSGTTNESEQVFQQSRLFFVLLNGYLSEACNYIKKRLQHMRFSVKFSKIFKNTYFEEHLRTTASVLARIYI